MASAFQVAILRKYSSGGLREMHGAILQELKDNPENVKRHPDFHEWARLIEGELSDRDEPVARIEF